MKIKIVGSAAILLSSLLAYTSGYAAVSGVVYEDLPVNGNAVNTYGQQDTNELGLAGITVTVTGAAGEESVTTDANGAWQTSSNLGADVRVVFSNFPTWLALSPQGSGSNSAVQFIQDGQTAHLGLHNPANYAMTANPPYIINLQQNGSGENNTNAALLSADYSATGLRQDLLAFDDSQGTGPLPLAHASFQQIGSTWGKAFHKEQQRLFVASALQRHHGFAPNKNPSSVFVFNYNGASTAATFLGSFDLQGVTPSNGGPALDFGTVCRENACLNDPGNTGIARDHLLLADPAEPNIDIDAYAKVGRMSYGDIDIDQASDTLWMLNLKQKGLVALDIAGGFNDYPQNVRQYLLESLPNAPTCTGGELRPWALTVHQDKGYIGAVCDAAVSKQTSDLHAYVFSFVLANPSAGLTPVLDFPLNYARKSGRDEGEWNVWGEDDVRKNTRFWRAYTQPILADLEFDAANHLYLSFIDRYGLQAGFKNYWPVSGATGNNERTRALGELLRACYVAGQFELEGTGSCTQTSTPENEFFNDTTGDGELEAAEGSLALLKGSQQILVTLLDPHPQDEPDARKYWFTKGVSTLSTRSGEVENWYSVIQTALPANGYNGKGAGIGDIELLTAAAPLEIGNRVWVDSNSNGLQDAAEQGIAGVTVQLRCGAQTATTTTDAQGHYRFADNQADITQWTDAQLPRQTACELSIQSNDSALAQRSATTAKQGNNAVLDSDGVLQAEKLVASFTTGRSGHNAHRYDFGFTPLIDLELSKVADRSQVNAGGQVVYTLTVSNVGPDPASNVIVSDQLPAQITYLSDDSQGAYDAATGQWLVGDLATGATRSLVITVQAK